MQLTPKPTSSDLFVAQFSISSFLQSWRRPFSPRAGEARCVGVGRKHRSRQEVQEQEVQNRKPKSRKCRSRNRKCRTGSPRAGSARAGSAEPEAQEQEVQEQEQEVQEQERSGAAGSAGADALREQPPSHGPRSPCINALDPHPLAGQCMVFSERSSMGWRIPAPVLI